MGLDATANALALNNMLNAFINGTTPFTVPAASGGPEFVSYLESVIDDGFQAAAPSMSNVDISPAAGTFTLPVAGGGITPDAIGQACADYWALAIGKGSPAVLSQVNSVSNDAAKIAAPITASLVAMDRSAYSTPYYYDFVTAIYAEILTIVWTVVESDSNGSTTLTVNVT